MTLERKTSSQTGLFIVAFYDVLFQSKLMLKWDDPKNLFVDGSSARVAFEDTIESVTSIRADFDGFKRGFSQAVHLPEDLQRELDKNPTLLDLVNKKVQYGIKSQSFSDTNIWFTTVDDANGSYLARDLAQIVSGVALAHLLALSRGVPCRGGIGLGCASDMLGLFSDPQRDEIYGPALLRAYEYESKTAQYPRVAVDDRLLQLVDDRWNNLELLIPGTPEFAMAQYENMYSQVIRDLVFLDDDGIFALDFAGKKAASSFIPTMTTTGGNPIAVFDDALEFVQRKYEQFLVEKDSLLAGRYFRLLSYLHSRQKYWKNSD